MKAHILRSHLYVGRSVDPAAYAALRDFVFSVSPEAAEANQQAAQELYRWCQNKGQILEHISRFSLFRPVC